jgi:hypothetical protein
MKRPHKVKVNEKVYEIVSKDKAWSKRHKAMGMIRYDAAKIEIAPHEDDTELLDTFLHELLHSIIEEYKVSIDRRSEEKIVRELSGALTQVLLENPSLGKWIHKKTEK